MYPTGDGLARRAALGSTCWTDAWTASPQWTDGWRQDHGRLRVHHVERAGQIFADSSDRLKVSGAE